MIQGLPPHKCKAAQAREDEQNRADERAKQAKVHAEKKGSKKGAPANATLVSAAPSASDDSKNRKRDRTMAMPSVPGRLPGGAGGQKKARSGHYDRDGFLIPEVPLRSFKSVNSVY